MTSLEKAMRLINDFCFNEYGNEADFTDLNNLIFMSLLSGVRKGFPGMWENKIILSRQRLPAM